MNFSEQLHSPSTASDAFHMLLTRIAKEHALPFEPLIPNQKTFNA